MSRYKASLLHLVASIVIASIACALLLGVWYPPPYFLAGGGLTLLLLLVGVDVTLGPLLTLAVFKTGKKGLKFDLSVIFLLQAAALGYGLHVMLESRPVFMAAAVDRFVMVPANAIDPQDLEFAARPQWKTLSWSGPRLVGTTQPTSIEDRNDLMFGALAGKDIEHLPRYYVDYADSAPGLLKRAKNLDLLRKKHPTRHAEIDDWLGKRRLVDADVVWLPIVARNGDLTMLMDKNSGEPLGAIDLDPW